MSESNSTGSTLIDKLSRAMGGALNAAAARADELMQQSPTADLEKNVRQHLVAQLAKQGLVTREDYDIQVALLAKTRAKLQDLEAKIAALESGTNPGTNAGHNDAPTQATSQ